jgi:hypothetical protein
MQIINTWKERKKETSSCTDRVRNEALQRVKEDRNIQQTIKGRKAKMDR